MGARHRAVLMLTQTLDHDDLDRAERLMARAPSVLIEALRLANMESSAALLAQIKDHKLRGQVLNRISGTLLRSWAAKVPPVREDAAWLGGAGTNLDYAAFWEFGFDGEVFVRAHTRRAARTRTASGKFRKRPDDSNVINVGAFTFHKTSRARPYARPALQEIREKVRMIHHERIEKAEGGLGRPE